MTKMIELVKFYKLGEFVGEIMLKGIIHPDMQLRNIGVRENGDFVFTDFAEMEKIVIPDELNENTVRRLTEALFSALDGPGKSFEKCSYFRAGFIAYGGLLAWNIFYNSANSGYSSKVFVANSPKMKAFDAKKLYEAKEIIDSIYEWQKIDISSINIEHYETLDQYNQSLERKKISQYNMFFLDMLYFTRICLGFTSIQNDGTKMSLPYALVNIACLAMNYGFIYTEYGLLKKCLLTNPGNEQITTLCKNQLFELLGSGKLNGDKIEFIDECLKKYSLFELLWILNDEDIIME